MKRALVIFSLLVITLSLMATDISGNQSGVWTLADSPYNLIGDVTIPAGLQLDIEAGVSVYAMGNYRINATGIINANGTEADSIRFMNGQTDPNALWVGIRLENESSPSSFSRCYIENASYGINSVNSPVEISYCRFNKNQKGMQLYGIGAANPAVMNVHHNIIERSIQNGILIPQNSNAHVHHNELRFNGTGTQYMAAIQLSNQSTGGANSPEINDNHIHHNFKQGITGWDIVGANAIQPHIHHNIIEYNLTGIYLLNASGYVEENIIRHNFIAGDSNSGAGVMVAGATSAPYFERNQVYGNFTGFYIGTNAQPVLGDLSIYHAWAQGENQIYDNIDESNTLHSVYTYSYTNASIVIKAENNFWGTNEPAEINLGINDQLDSASLPLVDYDPWYWDDPVSEVTGTVIYTGSLPLDNYRIEIVGSASRDVRYSADVSLGIPFSLEFDIDEAFHVVAKADVMGQQRVLYGSPDGLFTLPNLYPPDVSSNVGTIEIGTYTPPIQVTVGEPVDYNGRTRYPVTEEFWIYHWENINWLFDQGDFRYLQNQYRHVPGGDFLYFEFPDSNVWYKWHDRQHGDTWTRNEVIDNAGNIRTSYMNCMSLMDAIEVDGSRQPVSLIKETDGLGNLISQQIFHSDDAGYIYYLDTAGNTSAVYSYSGGFYSNYIATQSGLTKLQLEPQMQPHHLAYDPQQYDASSVLALFWQAPANDNVHTWTHYRVYDFGMLIDTIPYHPWLSMPIDVGVDHLITITAWDGENESAPSEPLSLMHVANEDQVMAPISLKLYPNPFSTGRDADLRVALEGAKSSGSLRIYNLKGQLVHQRAFSKEEAENLNWNGRDPKGEPCGSGIYLLKVALPGRKAITKKLAVF